jgi:periplasmic divalent cation tolerance protein
MNPSDALVVLCTCPEEAVEALVERLVAPRLVACVNVVGAVRSVYRWEGKLESDTESLLIMKTQRARVAALIEAIEGAHPYDVPEVLALPVESGSQGYLDWVFRETEIEQE